jgi:dienelactone hydrolase
LAAGYQVEEIEIMDNTRFAGPESTDRTRERFRCTRRAHGTRPRRHAGRGVAMLAVLAVLLTACGDAAETAAADETSPSAHATAEEASPSASPDPADTLFAYDADAPVEVVDVGTVEELGSEVRDVTYASPMGGDVPAYIAEPTEDPTDVGILMLHGIPEKRHAYLDPIARFACAGATAMVIDAPMNRDPDRPPYDPITFTEVDRDEQIQLIVDLRRAVDVLTQAGVERIGYDAVSYGAAIGAQLAGVEHRIDAFALLSADAGLADHFTNGDATLFPLSTRPEAEQQAWLEAMEPLSATHFVGDATAPLLFVSGRHDEVIPTAKAEALHQAAGENAEVRWYDTGHGLNPTAFIEHLAWLADQVGLDQQRVDECFADAF